jgi:hypothetical protein
MTQQDRTDDAAWHGRFAAIENEVDAIFKAEGRFHVRGLFFASANDATTARYCEAERRVAKGETTSHVVWTERAGT